MGNSSVKRAVKLAISAGFLLFDRAMTALIPGRARGHRSRGTVLMYHDVDAGERDRFTSQCAVLGTLGSVVELDEMVGHPDGEWRIAITFDDGLRSFQDVALPILTAHSLPSTLFVSTNMSDSQPGYEQIAERKFLTLAEVALLPTSVQIGSHGATHVRLPGLNGADLGYELSHSREALNHVVDRQVDYHAFPYGDHDERVVTQARDAGYKRCFSVRPCEVSGRDDYVVGRVEVSPGDWTFEFTLKALGAYRWMGWWMSTKARLSRGRGAKAFHG